MVRYAVVYLATLLVIGLLDALWLGVIAKSWYAEGMGDLLAPKINIYAAAAFYLLYPVGVVIFAVLPSGDQLGKAVLMGALFGLFCYGTYDMIARQEFVFTNFCADDHFLAKAKFFDVG